MSWFVPPAVCLVCYFVGIALGWYWRGVLERRLEAEDRRLEVEDWKRRVALGDARQEEEERGRRDGKGS